MFTILSIVLILISIVIQISNISAFPYDATAPHPWHDYNTANAVFSNETSGPPHFMIYADAFDGVTGPPAASAIEGFNVYAMSFLLLQGACDKAEEWTTLTDAQRSSVKSQYAAAGIKLIVSAFGSTDSPTTTGADPISTANTMSAWVKRYDLDGVDVDYEDFNAFNIGTAEAWIISFTKQLRTQLPQGSYIITHAPVAPWFAPAQWAGGGYLKVHASVGDLIDWYNIQFYNQGADEYSTCASLLTTSSNVWPQTALFQIASHGIPLSKLVIGKPGTASDASNGYMLSSTLASCLQQAKSQGWNGGSMVWKFSDATSSWITSVRSLSWPL